MDAFDLIVLGAGSAAREAATRAAEDHGARVALVERLRWGGDCPNVACKPTKQYVAAAELLHDLRNAAADLGINTPEPHFDLARLKARKDWLVGSQESWRARFDAAGHSTYAGEASFVDRSTVRVGDNELRAERILIATGSRTAVPPIAGLETVPWLDHVGMLELTELPRSLLVLGGGAVGLEFAQAFARFGSQVTLVEGAPRIAIRADADTTAEVAAALVDDGVELATGTFVTEVRAEDSTVVATLSPAGGAGPSRTVRADRILLAAGRTPNLEELELHRAGVESSRAGIVVDEHMRTTAPGIWAVGDVTATIQLTPVAGYQAQVAVDDMLGAGERTADYAVLPSAIFTDPELAGVGLTEEDARGQGLDVATATYAARDLVRPAYVNESRGLLKLVFDRSSRRLLGVHAAVRGGAELVQGYALALRLGATIDDVALSHYAFPTVGEGLHYAAESARTYAAATA